MAKSGGDLLVVQREEQNPTYADALVNGDATVLHLAVARVGFTFYVQKINVFYVTHANAKTITFQDTTGTPVVLGVLNDFTAAAGVPDVLTADFGPHGTALPANKGFDVKGSSSGPVANIHIEGYYRQSSTINLTTAPSAS